MTASAITANINESLDVHLNVAAEVALHYEVVVDGITKFNNLVVREILRAGVGVDARHRQNFLRRGQPDSENVRESLFDSLVTWQIYTGYTCHNFFTSLTLTLFVLGIFANNHDATFALDDFAFVAHLFD